MMKPPSPAQQTTIITPAAAVSPRAFEAVARLNGKAQYRLRTGGSLTLKEAAMALRIATVAASILLLSGSAGARTEQSGTRSAAQQGPHNHDTREVIATGRVEHVFGPQLFTIALAGQAADQPLLVFAPTATASPFPGTGLTAHGTLGRCDDDEVETVGGCNQFDERARGDQSSRAVLIARLVITSKGRQLTGRMVRSPNAAPLS